MIIKVNLSNFTVYYVSKTVYPEQIARNRIFCYCNMFPIFMATCSKMDVFHSNKLTSFRNTHNILFDFLSFSLYLPIVNNNLFFTLFLMRYFSRSHSSLNKITQDKNKHSKVLQFVCKTHLFQ